VKIYKLQNILESLQVYFPQ